MSTSNPRPAGHVCPWWLLPTFDNPLRSMVHPPERILGDLVQPGCKVMDLGCGMGYFTLPLAKLVGADGQVWAVDLQPQMLEGLRRRALQVGLLDRIHLHLCQSDQIGVPEPVDFALAFWMVHETGDASIFLRQVKELLKPGGRFLLVEPKLHVTTTAYQRTFDTAQSVGMKPLQELSVTFSRAHLFENPNRSIA